MSKFGGMDKPGLHALPQIKDWLSFVYLEQCQITKKDSAIKVADDKGIIYVPAASISVLMLGPGTLISHRAMELIGDMGVSVVWVGEHGVRYYASGRSLTHSSRLLVKQAALVSNQRTRLAIVRRMYELRFPNENVTGLTLQQLRGREGSRVRAFYRRKSKEYGISWNGRVYDPENFEDGDAVNKALSIGNACLYGLAHAVIAALGCSPGLGFIHTGHENSFVYDIADLYKSEVTVPVAFKVAGEESDISGLNLESKVRRMVRDEFVAKRILERMVRDIRWLLSDGDGDEGESSEPRNALYLWDDRKGAVESGRLYGDCCEPEGDSPWL